MTEQREDRAARYLDGEMSHAEADRFERDLLKPEVAQELREELLFRELMRTLSPLNPPAELVEELEQLMAGPTEGATEKSPRFVRLRAALAGWSWAYRGSSYAVDGLSGVVGTGRIPVQQLSNLRYRLGPLSGSYEPAKEKPAPQKKPAWWRRLLRRRRRKS